MAAPTQKADIEESRLFVSADLQEDLIAVFYLLLKQDRLLDKVFWSQVPPLSEFLAWFKQPDFRGIGAFVQCGTRVELAGMGWLYAIRGPDGCRRADAGLVFLRKFWGGDFTISLTSQMIRMAFGELKVDVIYGTTLAKNRMSLALARRMGAKMFGPLPKWGMSHGVSADVMLGYITKQDWWGA